MVIAWGEAGGGGGGGLKLMGKSKGFFWGGGVGSKILTGTFVFNFIFV